MGSVIYSASPLQSFMGSLETILFIFVIGVTGIGLAFFKQKQSRSSKLIVGILGIFLVVASIVSAAFILFSVLNGAQSITANLNKKTIAVDNCGDNGETCQRYVLETIKGSTAYDFNVPQDAFNNAQPSTCYKFTYYPNKGLFSSEADSYQQINNVTHIEIADPTGCQ